MAASVAEPDPAPAPVVGVNDWSRVSVAWDRVFDDVATISADLKDVFKDAYHSAQVDERARRGREEGLSSTVSSLAAQQFLGVSEHLDRGLAGAKAVMGAVGEALHDGGTERIHGEVEGAVKVSLYEMGMLLIRMSERLDGDVPPYTTQPAPPQAQPQTQQQAPQEATPEPVIDLRDPPTAPVAPVPERQPVVIRPD